MRPPELAKVEARVAIPLEALRLAWRIDKAHERGEGAEHVFDLVDALVLVMDGAGFRGVADWLREITSDREV